MKRKNVIIQGAAGRDFHNFNVFFRNNREYNVAAFTTAQILSEHRVYPKSLAGRLYPKGIPIHPENEITGLIRKHSADIVVFSYSDVSHEDVMHHASIALSSGADFMLLGPKSTCIKTNKPLISVCAVRTGAGKSPVSRFIAAYLKRLGYRVVVIRHPMPYGDLRKQIVQRFADYEDLDRNKCTIEEREEYEPHIKQGIVVYAGADYEKIIRSAEKEADIILWDGGNNDFSFYDSEKHLKIVVADPHRAGHELKYHPGETNFRMADLIIISKTNTAGKESVQAIIRNARMFNPKAAILKAALEISVENSGIIKNKKVLVVEDGPTLTHGGMNFGAGHIAAKRFNCKIADAARHAVGSIKNVYKEYKHLKLILPAMGYSEKQIKEMEKTINATPCDAVIDASPVTLSKLMTIKKPVAEVEYELKSQGMEKIIKNFAGKRR